MTSQSFADFVATQDARNDIQLNIRKYTLMLCDCLTDDFTRRHPNSLILTSSTSKVDVSITKL